MHLMAILYGQLHKLAPRRDMAHAFISLRCEQDGQHGGLAEAIPNKVHLLHHVSRGDFSPRVAPSKRGTNSLMLRQPPSRVPPTLVGNASHTGAWHSRPDRCREIHAHAAQKHWAHFKAPKSITANTLLPVGGNHRCQAALVACGQCGLTRRRWAERGHCLH